jgi:hypothetical protein
MRRADGNPYNDKRRVNWVVEAGGELTHTIEPPSCIEMDSAGVA